MLQDLFPNLTAPLDQSKFISNKDFFFHVYGTLLVPD